MKGKNDLGKAFSLTLIILSTPCIVDDDGGGFGDGDYYYIRRVKKLLQSKLNGLNLLRMYEIIQ